jgi:hypothetical protein
MQTPTRPERPVDPAAARRNYLIFSIASAIGTIVLVAAVVLLLV